MFYKIGKFHIGTKLKAQPREESRLNDILIPEGCCEEERLEQIKTGCFRGSITDLFVNDSDCVTEGLIDLSARFATRFIELDKMATCDQNWRPVRKVKLEYVSKVKSYAPHVYHYVFDIAFHFE